MKIVSSNSDPQLAEKRAIADVQYAVRALAVNLLRIARGAGKPFELSEQAAALVLASERLAETGAMALPSEIYSEALAWRREGLDGSDVYEKREARAQDQVIAGALQIAASRMAEQLAIERIGENEFLAGCRELETVGEERRKEWQATLRASRSKPPRVRAKPTKR